jgi:hypothetical protein
LDVLQNRELRGWKAFYALLVYIPPLLQWIATMLLYIAFVVFVIFGHQAQKKEGDGSRIATPSSTAILAIVCTHAGFFLPLSTYILLQVFNEVNDFSFVWAAAQAYLEVFMVATGLPAAVVSAVLQIWLMITRSRSRLGLGDLSVLSLRLQVFTLAMLAVAQYLRSPWGTGTGSQPLYTWVCFMNPAGIGYAALALSQLLVLGVALGLGHAEGEIPL